MSNILDKMLEEKLAKKSKQIRKIYLADLKNSQKSTTTNNGSKKMTSYPVRYRNQARVLQGNNYNIINLDKNFNNHNAQARKSDSRRPTKRLHHMEITPTKETEAQTTKETKAQTIKRAPTEEGVPAEEGAPAE